MKKLLFPAMLLCALSFSSCRVFYPDLMFKTGPDFQYNVPDSMDRYADYVLKPGDALTMSILSNNGYQLVDVIGTNTGAPIEYTIASTGFASMPLLDSVSVAGYTLLGLETYLEERYAYYFLNPYIRIQASNRRAIVFIGRGSGTTVSLENERVQLVELLAQSGGFAGQKAFKVKVIRGDIKNPEVFLFDFSTIEAFKNTDFLVQNQDIIHVEPSLTLADVNAKILPVISTVSTILLIYAAVYNLGN